MCNPSIKSEAIQTWQKVTRKAGHQAAERKAAAEKAANLDPGVLNSNF